MGVVVPWSARRFQYTVKDVARPALGSLWVDGVEHPVAAGDSWAVLDHGRGRWPYAVHWNWGAGSGLVDGRVIGVQVGGRWTDRWPWSRCSGCSASCAWRCCCANTVRPGCEAACCETGRAAHCSASPPEVRAARHAVDPRFSDRPGTAR